MTIQVKSYRSAAPIVLKPFEVAELEPTEARMDSGRENISPPLWVGNDRVFFLKRGWLWRGDVARGTSTPVGSIPDRTITALVTRGPGAADVYEDHENDERVLNDETGHRSSETRRQMYQEREREEVRAKSAATRRRVRQVVFGVPLVADVAIEREQGEVEAVESAPAYGIYMSRLALLSRSLCCLIVQAWKSSREEMHKEPQLLDQECLSAE